MGVDDNTTNLFALKLMIKKLEVVYQEAHNGKEAVVAFEEKPADLVLMDINMPVMNGYDASKCIKEWCATKGLHTKIVALSAQNEPVD